MCPALWKNSRPTHLPAHQPFLSLNPRSWLTRPSSLSRTNSALRSSSAIVSIRSFAALNSASSRSTFTSRSASEHSTPPQALGYRVGTSLWEALALFHGRSAGMLSAVYPPSLPLAFSPSALLALSPSWLSVLPVLAFASPFRPLPSPAVCPALPSLLLAGALRLRPPVRRPHRRTNRRKRLRAGQRPSSSRSSFASGWRITTSLPRPWAT